MKRIFLVSILLFCGYFSSEAMAGDTDSLQVLKRKLALVEKQVAQLQAEVKTLRSADSSLSATLQSIKKNTPEARQRKLVINRRGSKQAYLQ